MKDDQLVTLLSSLAQDLTEIKKALAKPELRKGESSSDVTGILNDIKSSIDQLRDSLEQKSLDPHKLDASLKLLGDEILKLREPIDAIHNSVYPNTKEIHISYLWPWQRLLYSLLWSALFFALGLASSAALARYIHGN